MQHNEFKIGEMFWCSDRQWRCTDIGTRTIIAIRIDSIDVGSTDPESRRTLNRAQGEAEGWFNGPPYAGVEVVFDEDYMPVCSIESDQYKQETETDLANAIRHRIAPLGGVDLSEHPPVPLGDPSSFVIHDPFPPDDIYDEATRRYGIEQARALREQARVGGLRFEAYLPSDLAEWLLDLVEYGVFVDPSEAVFVMLTEQRDLQPHADLREEILRRSCQEAMNDPHPGIPHDEAMAELQRRMEEPRSEPAVWKKTR